VDASNQVYRAEDGLLLSKDGRKLIVCPSGREGTLLVPGSVEIIGFGAFEDSKLTNITFSADANILSFGYRAFYHSQITQMHVPASVVTIDYYAFAMCENLTRVTFAKDNQLTGVYEGAFYGCRNLTDVVIPEEVTSIGKSAFYACSSLTKLVIPDGLTSIGEEAFYACSSLTIYCNVGTSGAAAIKAYNLYFVDPDYPDFKIYQIRRDGSSTVKIIAGGKEDAV